MICDSIGDRTSDRKDSACRRGRPVPGRSVGSPLGKGLHAHPRPTSLPSRGPGGQRVQVEHKRWGGHPLQCGEGTVGPETTTTPLGAHGSGWRRAGAKLSKGVNVWAARCRCPLRPRVGASSWRNAAAGPAGAGRAPLLPTAPRAPHLQLWKTRFRGTWLRTECFRPPRPPSLPNSPGWITNGPVFFCCSESRRPPGRESLRTTGCVCLHPPSSTPPQPPARQGGGLTESAGALTGWGCWIDTPR